MAQQVKRRSYNSPRRAEQAAATRRQILEAAQRLFEDQGYAATTMAAIAKEAGVAVKTVYLGFETKSGVLRALWNLLLRGDQEEAPVGQRPWYAEMLDDRDPESKLRRMARISRMVKTRAGGVMGVIRSATHVDPDIAALWDRIQSDFHENQGGIVSSLAEQGTLRRDLDAARATDILWTINHPDIWQLLVAERGWTPEEYERWTFELARDQLLDGR